MRGFNGSWFLTEHRKAKPWDAPKETLQTAIAGLLTFLVVSIAHDSHCWRSEAQAPPCNGTLSPEHVTVVPEQGIWDVIESGVVWS